jgi:predicted ATPase/serine/threonine protein kinase
MSEDHGSKCQEEGEIVHESSSAELRRIRMNNGRHILAKTLLPDASLDDVCRLQNEYYILSGPLAKGERYIQKTLGLVTEKDGKQECRLGQVLSDIPDNLRNSNNTIFLEWADGISLQEWIEHQSLTTHRRSSVGPAGNNGWEEAELISVVSIMREVALSLSAVHKAGILHNDVIADHFILNTKEDITSHESTYSVKIISFGYASPVSLQEVDDEGETVNDDLYSLGIVFRDILKGCFGARSVLHKDSSDSLELGSMKRTSIRGMLMEEDKIGNAPVYLSRIVTNLTKGTRERSHDASRQDIDCDAIFLPDPHYKQAREVVEVLTRILDNPGAFLFAGVRLKIDMQPRALIGRVNEYEQLLQAYHRVSGPQGKSCSSPIRPELVLLFGAAGTGKTVLVRKLASLSNTGENVCFAYGKFDQLRRNEPLSALLEALENLCQCILSSSIDFQHAIRNDIEELVGTEIGVLTQLVPSLTRIFGPEDIIEASPVSLNGVQAVNRFHFVFRLFARAVGGGDRTIVLALDDLQWADDASLGIVRSIMTDLENDSSLLIIGTYRDDEVDGCHPLKRATDGIERIRRIKLGDLNPDDLNEMVANAIHVPRLETSKPLTEVVLSKTNGNAFFSIQFLQSLIDRGLLLYHDDVGRWACDLSGAMSMNVTDNVVDLLSSKIHERLTLQARSLLILAACLGSVFDTQTLQVILPVTGLLNGSDASEELLIENQSNMEESLASLVDEGLVNFAWRRRHSTDEDDSHGRYKFAHDRIHQAAYSIIPAKMKSKLHFQIGRILWNHLKTLGAGETSSEFSAASTSVLNDLLFLSADQMNKGLDDVVDTRSKVELAQLNLKVGKKCMAKSAFNLAAKYFETGIVLLPDRSVDEYYRIFLQLHNYGIEAEYCTGNFDIMWKMSDRLLKSAQNFMDKLDAYITVISALGTQDRYEEAIETGLDVLEKLGETFPRNEPVSQPTILYDLWKTKRTLNGMTDEKLLSLRPMSDKKNMAAMNMLSKLLMYAYQARMDLFPLLVFRMMRLSIMHGVSDAAAFACATYGTILVGALQDYAGGYRFGRLALGFLRRSQSKAYVAKVTIPVCYIINHWTAPLNTNISELTNAYRMGMEAGDIDYAFACASTSCMMAFYSGARLDTLVIHLRKLCGQMLEYGAESPRGFTIPLLQVALSLVEPCNRPWLLKGEAINMDLYLEEEGQVKNHHNITLVNLYGLFVAYIFGQFEIADIRAENSRDVNKTILGSVHVWNHRHFDCLTALALARSSPGGRRKWRKIARSAYRQIKKWSRICPNLSQKKRLLEAEFASLKKTSSAIKIYDEAISEAARAQVIYDEAIACERAGDFCKELGDAQGANRYFARARECYVQWGAHNKVRYLTDLGEGPVAEESYSKKKEKGPDEV